MFEIIMQYNPLENHPVDMQTINELIDLVWEEFTIGNYNFFVLSRTDIASYMQYKITENGVLVLEVLQDGKVYRLELDDRETLKLIFKGYYELFDLDLKVFTDVTELIRKEHQEA